MLIEHRPSHLNYSAVVSFHDSILLRNARGEKLLINPMLKAKLIKRDIFELSPIVTANSFQAVEMLIVQPQSHALKVLKHFILVRCLEMRCAHNASDKTSCHLLGFSSIFFLISLIRVLLLDSTCPLA
jgi:hypothetical protein